MSARLSGRVSWFPLPLRQTLTQGSVFNVLTMTPLAASRPHTIGAEGLRERRLRFFLGFKNFLGANFSTEGRVIKGFRHSRRFFDSALLLLHTLYTCANIIFHQQHKKEHVDHGKSKEVRTEEA